jgi:hypothetical protein
MNPISKLVDKAKKKASEKIMNYVTKKFGGEQFMKNMNTLEGRKKFNAMEKAFGGKITRKAKKSLLTKKAAKYTAKKLLKR